VTGPTGTVAPPAAGAADAVAVADSLSSGSALPPHEQVVRAVSPLLRGPDGTHRLVLHLEPEHLGALRVQLSVNGSDVAVQLVASDSGTREALRQNVDGLRAHLEGLGLRSTGIDVLSGGGPAPRDHDEAPHRSRPDQALAASRGAAAAAPARVLPATTTSTTALDLRM
jgi:hypothetical protein